MPSRIRQLPEGLIAKIAAGEVIERPASVVKELVENSIDAGAKQIIIEVEEGGRRLIRVSDDGCGMSREEAGLSIVRHATSKIKEEADLFRIQTLGFRGEALPSIAAVSRLTLETQSEESPGTLIEIDGGKGIKTISTARQPGTTVTIRNLFFNTPARLKFLKSKETEQNHIADFVETIALSRPEVGFSLRGETPCPPRRTTRERIQDLFGEEIAASLKPVSLGRGGIELCGFVSDHQVTSSSSKSLYFFVNGRPVRDRTMQHAVLAAYENLLMKHRYPWAFLTLTIPPDFVDVNVHPTKAEVRFANGSLIHDLVREGVRDVLKGEGGVASISCGTRSLYRDKGGREAGGSLLPHPVAAPWLRSNRSSEIFAASPSPFTVPPIKIIGQIHGTYLICETPEKLVLIDQHAAHERIGFEKLKKQFEQGGVARQALLLPQTFELKPSEAEILKMYLPDLEKFGLETEPFGRSSFILRAVPVLLSDEDCVRLVKDLIETLQAHGKLTPLEERVHEILETIACHSQVRAGDRLSPSEIEALIGEMETTPFSYSCPHGRPVKIEFSFGEIEGWFKRRV